MRSSRFTEQQIVAALRQAESGTSVVEVCRKLGFTEQTFYRWKRKFAGMGVAELQRLREVEKENRRLKQLVADLTLDKQMLQEALRKNWQSRPRSEQGCSSSGSERRACRVAGVLRLSLSQSGQGSGSLAPTLAGAGSRAGTVRLSAAPCAAATGRLASKS